MSTNLVDGEMAAVRDHIDENFPVPIVARPPRTSIFVEIRPVDEFHMHLVRTIRLFHNATDFEARWVSLLVGAGKESGFQPTEFGL